MMVALFSAMLNVPAVHAAEKAVKTHELCYKFKPGETIRYEVEHMATVDTRISATDQKAKSRSRSTMVWKFIDAEPGHFKFIQSLEKVDLWQQAEGQDEIRYNSETDETPPAAYERVSETLEQPVATITIDDCGELIQREGNGQTPDLGFGGIVVVLPPKPIPVGHQWYVGDTLRVRDRNKQVKEISVRLKHELKSVKTGVATISVQTQVLTPINDAQLESQLVQRLSRGEIKFDLIAGRVIEKRLDWDESVVGFNGPESSMKYLARFTESLVANETATANNADAESVNR